MSMSKSKKGKTRKIKHCDLKGAVSDKYLVRKTQKVGMEEDNEFIRKHGIDYFEDKMIIKELFTQEIAVRSRDDFGQRKSRRSYIYIISKKIDDRTFIKLQYLGRKRN